MTLRLPRAADVGTSYLASISRGGRGRTASRPVRRRPEKPLEYYGFEACPYGRLVREALAEMDLDVLVHPCPEGGQRFRPRTQALGGKVQFPFLMDPNTDHKQYESLEIVRYLARTYGSDLVPAAGLTRRLAVAGSYLSSALRLGRGVRARASMAPARPLELYSFEASPYSRLVREVLDELELPYLLRNCGKQGHHRPALAARAGKIQLPYLVDPNEGIEMFESAQIIEHLERHYAA